MLRHVSSFVIDRINQLKLCSRSLKLIQEMIRMVMRRQFLNSQLHFSNNLIVVYKVDCHVLELFELLLNSYDLDVPAFAENLIGFKNLVGSCNDGTSNDVCHLFLAFHLVSVHVSFNHFHFFLKLDHSFLH